MTRTLSCNKSTLRDQSHDLAPLGLAIRRTGWVKRQTTEKFVRKPLWPVILIPDNKSVDFRRAYCRSALFPANFHTGTVAAQPNVSSGVRLCR